MTTDAKHYIERPFDPETEAALIAAIGRAEKGNRGEVRVHIESNCPCEDPHERARELFTRLGMSQTHEGTGVLLYVAVEAEKSSVFSGPGIKATEAGFWKGVSDLVEKGFADKNPGMGLVRAVDQIGDLLRKNVPGEDVSGNELPDEVTSS